MASAQSDAVKRLYQHWVSMPASNPEWTLEDQRNLVEAGWPALTSEPEGVDYVETDAGEVPALWCEPKNADRDYVLLAIHGGGFISGSPWTHRKFFAHLGKLAGARMLIPDYQLLPGGRHPVPLEACFAAYKWLLDRGVNAGHIAFTGDSAGGGLAITTQLLARERGLPLPAAAMPLSPWVDFEVTGETMITNADKDCLFTKEWVEQMAAEFIGDRDPRDPFVNPLHADLTGLGPIYIQVGGDEMLLDDSRRLAAHAERLGVEVRLEVFPEMQHTFQMMAGHAPEADDAIRRLASWARTRLALAEPASTP